VVRKQNEALAEAVLALTKVGMTYTSVSCSDMNEGEAWGQIECALRRPPPEGEIIHYELSAVLAEVAALMDPGEPT
jgi:hypothetical protein